MVREEFSPKGVYCAMITPFDTSGRIDYGQVRGMIRFLIRKKVDGVFPVSNVGEFVMLSMEERKEFIQSVLEEGCGLIRVIPGISDLSVDNCLELAEFSRARGADGVVACAPYYYPYSQQYIKQFLTYIADCSPLPVILYNSPSFTNKIEFDTLIELCSHKNVIAVKESSGDVKFLLMLKAELDRRMSHTKLLLGWEELFFTGLTLGASGCIVSSAAIVPELLTGIDECYKKGDLSSALQLQMDVADITAELKRFGFPFGYKLGVLSRGFDFKLFRGKPFELEESEVDGGTASIKGVIKEKLIRAGYSSEDI